MKTEASLPKEFEDALRAKLGSSFDSFVASLRQLPPVSIRLNPKKSFQLNGTPVPWSKWGKYLNERPVFTLDPSFHSGAYYVQEASSMFIEQALMQSNDLTKPLRVLDLCAAPGGKSTHLLSLLSTDSLLVSNEVIRPRAVILSENIQKWGHANVMVTNNDPEDFSALTGFFDVIVVDAPCSGEGLFRKDTDAIDEWSPANVDLCSQRQRRILANIWPALKPNGILIYCTCTYNEHENEENLQWLQAQHDLEFISLPIDESWGIETIGKANAVGYRFYPHQVMGEGFFLAVVRKKEEPQPHRVKSKRSLPLASKKVAEQIREWVKQDDLQFFLWNDLVYGVPSALSKEMEAMIQQFRIVHAGTPIATMKHEKFIPEHALALSIDLKKACFPQMEVSLENALRYLRKEPIDVGAAKRGYTLITFKDLPLGWMNVLDNRSNNLYPKEWRIRMADR